MDQSAGHIIDTPLGALTLRRATLADVSTVLTIMLDAAQLPLTRGMDMWGWVGTPTGEKVIRERIEKDEVYIGDLAAQPIATMCIQWSDPLTWGELGSDESAGYVHGLAVLREYHGNDIGKALIDWAARRIAAHGKRRLRLDCMGENSQLCRYYEKELGMTAVGTRDGAGWSAKLFEKEITPDAADGKSQE